MKTRPLFGFLFSFFLLSGFAQKTSNKITDSLKTKLRNASVTDKINIYKELSEEYDKINLDSSLYFAKQGYNLAQKNNNNSLKVDLLNQLAVANYNKSNLNIALEHHKKALKIALTGNDTLKIANTYNGIGNTYSKLGKYKLSVKNYFQSLPLYEELRDTAMMGASYLNIAVNFRKIKEPQKALEYNKKALTIFLLQKNEIYSAMVYTNLGGVSNDLKKYKQSIDYSTKGKEYFSKLGYERYTAYPLTNMGVSYDSLNQKVLAEKSYKKAIELHTINKEAYELAFLNNALANFYYKQNDFKSAINKGLTALKYANDINSLEFQSSSSKTLGKSYEKTKEYKKSIFYYKKYATLKDSVFESQKTKDLFEIKEEYETEKKEKEIAIQKQKLLQKEITIKNRNLYATVVSSALLFLAIISFAYYHRSKFIKKQLEKEIELKDALATIKTQNRLQEQRLRISRDLHDNIGSQLTFIISSLDNLKFVSKDVSEKFKDKITNISSFTVETIHQLRDTIWAMNKSEITTEDFYTRLLTFIEKAKSATNNSIDFKLENSVKDPIIFTSMQGINLFRSIQEALNNAIKYADASTITLTSKLENNTLHITIKDNGKGFELKHTELGNGLSNIEHRMSEINGKAVITSKVGKGTQIELQLPV